MRGACDLGTSTECVLPQKKATDNARKWQPRMDLLLAAVLPDCMLVHINPCSTLVNSTQLKMKKDEDPGAAMAGEMHGCWHS